MRIFSKKRYLILMLSPILILYCTFIIMPAIISFYYSFTDFTGIGQAELVGVENFKTLFEKDFIFRIALKNNLIIVAILLIFEVALAFLLALLLAKAFRGNLVARAMIYSPNIIAPIMIGLMWVYILDPIKGVLNSILRSLNLDFLAKEWIGSGSVLSLISIAIIIMWNSLGFYATVYLAGLTAIPDDLYEAASIDGASSLQRIWYITIPLVKETTIMIIILIITNSFKLYEIVYQLTGGGPAHTSETLITYLYNTTFKNGRYGYGMSVAVMTFLVSCVFSFAYLVLAKRNSLGEEG